MNNINKFLGNFKSEYQNSIIKVLSDQNLSHIIYVYTLTPNDAAQYGVLDAFKYRQDNEFINNINDKTIKISLDNKHFDISKYLFLLLLNNNNIKIPDLWIEYYLQNNNIKLNELGPFGTTRSIIALIRVSALKRSPSRSKARS